GMPEKLGRYARDRLERRHVEVRTGAAVRRVRSDAVELDDGTEIGTETVIWTAGVRGDPEAERWGLPVDRGGRIRVEPTLQVPGRPEVYVVGDLAYVEDEAGRPLPQVAPVAIQQAERAAANVLAGVRGEGPQPFRYEDPGMLAVIGRNAAVADVKGRAFTGFIAWILWLVVHIFELIGFRNRLLVLVNWAWNYLFYERAVRLILPLQGGAAPGERVEDEVVSPAPEGPAAVGE
ncbi:MAG TPA: FAD-dependent oxidoreductase, partial [Longimicrobiales bacterium]|nr:FAD-dependent oxidoreductase [Longimicrobiales bacterium]